MFRTVSFRSIGAPPENVRCPPACAPLRRSNPGTLLAHRLSARPTMAHLAFATETSSSQTRARPHVFGETVETTLASRHFAK